MERELNKLFNDINYNKENVIIREIWSIKLELQNFFWGVYIKSQIILNICIFIRVILDTQNGRFRLIWLEEFAQLYRRRVDKETVGRTTKMQIDKANQLSLMELRRKRYDNHMYDNDSICSYI